MDWDIGLSLCLEKWRIRHDSEYRMKRAKFTRDWFMYGWAVAHFFYHNNQKDHVFYANQLEFRLKNLKEDLAQSRTN